MSGHPRRQRAPVAIAALLLLVIVVVVGGVWLAFFRDSAQPASIAEALAAYRERAERGPTRIPSGVYVYATEGQESVDALGGARHNYPPRSTITVTAADCGTTLRWDVLRGRSTAWTTCTDDGGETLAAVAERHRFFGRTEHTDYTCSGTVARPAEHDPGMTWKVACDTASGILERGTGTVISLTELPVAGAPVPVAHIRFRTTFAGSTRGETTRDMWVERETGLPVRVRLSTTTVNGSPIGDVTYRELAQLDLVSLTPRR
jgi:hypothetical protein